MSRILLAEDDRVIRDITVMYLTKNGLQVDVTDNGNSACQLIEMNRYDCIVLDIMMPGKDGREVCRLIRNKYDVPVIFLLLKINALINRYRGLLVKNGMIVIDDLVIEPAKRRVTIGGTDVALPPKEYDLLMYLLDNKDIVLTRDQILDHVWGADYEGYDRAVDTHIKKLRAALGTMGSHIETVIKAGYKWKS